MGNWFECKVKYEKPSGNDNVKKVTDSYIVDALSFTESEARIIKEVSAFTDEIEVAAIKKTKISEVLFSIDANDDKWFKCKVAYITVNDKGVEKRTITNMLVQASDIDKSRTLFNDHMRGSMCDYILESVSETKIMDVYVYEKPLVENEDEEFCSPF